MDSADFTIENGILKKYNGSQRDIVIPQGVVGIGPYAFYLKNLRSVKFNSDLKYIGESAFEGCFQEIDEIILPNGFYRIDARAFFGCDKINKLYFPPSTTHFGKNVLYGCTIGELAMPEITIKTPEDALIKSTANAISFVHGAKSIKKFTLIVGIRNDLLVSSFFCSCLYPEYKSKSILESVVISDGFQRIDDSAFLNCPNLKSISLPKSINYIGESAFSGCIKLKNVMIPEGVKSIYDCAFYHCNALEKVTIPNSCTYIYRAFTDCPNLREVTIPKRFSRGLFKSGLKSIFGDIRKINFIFT